MGIMRIVENGTGVQLRAKDVLSQQLEQQNKIPLAMVNGHPLIPTLDQVLLGRVCPTSTQIGDHHQTLISTGTVIVIGIQIAIGIVTTTATMTMMIIITTIIGVVGQRQDE
jgi:hypothetical protein